MKKESVKKLKDTRKKLYELRDKIEDIVIEDIKKCSCISHIDENCIILPESESNDLTENGNNTITYDCNERAENVISALDAIDVALTFIDAALYDM